MKYKVIKGTDFLEKGDVFELGDNMWKCNVKATANDGAYSMTSNVTVSDEYMSELETHGIVIKLVEDTKIGLTEDATDYKQLYLTYKNNWYNTDALLKSLYVKYEDALNNALDEYAAGHISECQKVEATTVYNNLITLVKNIKEQLDR